MAGESIAMAMFLERFKSAAAEDSGYELKSRLLAEKISALRK
jgi:hypothetical protein